MDKTACMRCGVATGTMFLSSHACMHWAAAQQVKTHTKLEKVINVRTNSHRSHCGSLRLLGG